MRILFVAFSESIHTARWIKQLQGEGWDTHLFPSLDQGVTHSQLSNITVYHSVYGKHKNWPEPAKIKKIGLNIGHSFLAAGIRFVVEKIFPKYRVRQLARLIKKLQPDLIHSLEIQHGGYLVEEVRKTWQGKFPKWLVTNWGSDIYLFGRQEEHRQKIRDVLEHCDYYSCECQRDIRLAEEFGFKGVSLPVLPNTGGLDLQEARALRTPGKTSDRRVIALKGYHNWAGKALVGLEALEKCKDVLSGYEVAIYSIMPANSGVKEAAERFSARTGIPIRIFPPRTPHQEILKLHGQSRVSIGLSISDGASTSFLEALAMGSFPIQSDTACADEWIECGKTGLLVPAEDVEVIAKNIRQALTDDELVDRASEGNWDTARKRLDKNVITRKVIEQYRSILKPGISTKYNSSNQR